MSNTTTPICILHIYRCIGIYQITSVKTGFYLNHQSAGFIYLGIFTRFGGYEALFYVTVHDLLQKWFDAVQYCCGVLHYDSAIGLQHISYRLWLAGVTLWTRHNGYPTLFPFHTHPGNSNRGHTKTHFFFFFCFLHLFYQSFDKLNTTENEWLFRSWCLVSQSLITIGIPAVKVS